MDGQGREGYSGGNMKTGRVREGGGWIATGETAGTNSYVYGLDLSGSLQGAGGVGGLLSATISTISGDSRPPQVETASTFSTAFDANGNITEYVDATGAFAAHREYGPFGETTASSGPMQNAFTHWWSTKPWDPITGFSEYEFRMYSPELGRWISRDPIGERGGYNLFGFVENESPNAIDVRGLFGESVDSSGLTHLRLSIVNLNPAPTWIDVNWAPIPPCPQPVGDPTVTTEGGLERQLLNEKTEVWIADMSGEEGYLFSFRTRTWQNLSNRTIPGSPCTVAYNCKLKCACADQEWFVTWAGGKLQGEVEADLVISRDQKPQTDPRGNRVYRNAHCRIKKGEYKNANDKCKSEAVGKCNL